ncbi:MAG: zinc-ribbon domain-containing protein [Desulfomicrobium sp.]
MNITCPQCGFERTVSEEKLPPKAVMATCPKCRHRFKFREITPPGAAEQPPEPVLDNTPVAPADRDIPNQQADQARPEPPKHAQDLPPAPPQDEDLWSELAALKEEDEEPYVEHRPEPSLPLWEKVDSGYPRAFAQTFLDVLARPKAFFSAMPVGHGILKPLLFFLIIIEAVALSQAAWQLLGILPPSMLTEDLGRSLQAALVLVLYPLEVCLFLFLDTAINHFFLRLFKADTKGFEGTFRAEAYSAAPMLLMIVPYIGLPLAMIGVVVYKFLGLRHVHGATSKQVLAVLVLPMLLAMTVAIVLTLLTGGA